MIHIIGGGVFGGGRPDATDAAVAFAERCASAPESVVFASPIATFKTEKGAAEKDIANGLALGLLISVLGQVGDLLLSAIKRDLGIKDMGSLIPGHGGVLDRIDALTSTLPVAAFALGLWALAG